MTSDVCFRLTQGPNPLILVPVSVEGKGPYSFILDSGASISLLSAELGRSLQVAVTGQRDGMGAAGAVTIQLGRVGSLSVGAAELHDVEVGLTDELDRIGAFVGAKIDGDLGYNVLRHFRVQIDYGKSLMGLSRTEDGGAAKPNDGTIPFRIAPAKPLILFPTHVNGRGPYTFCVDTGTSMTAVSPALAAELGVAMAPAGGPGMGAGGKIQVSFGRIESLAVGNRRLSDVAVTSADFFSAISRACGTQLDGIIGYNFLKNFRLTIDYPGEGLRLEPHRN